MAHCTLCSRTIGYVCVDVILSEAATDEIEITEHPVEAGANVSDHAWLKPRKIVISGIKAEALSGYQELRALQTTLEPFDLITGLDLYQNMLIQSLTATRDTENSRVLSFEATCQEVIIVNTETSDGDAGDYDRASKTQNRGQVQARDSSSSGMFDGVFSGGKVAS